MKEEISLCVICAWRKECQKRFLKRDGISFRCPEFSRDVTVKDKEKADDKGKDKEGNKKIHKDL